MAGCCLPFILLLVGGVATAPVTEVDTEDEDAELILVANAGYWEISFYYMHGLGLEDLHPRQVIEGDIVIDPYTRYVTGLGEEEDLVDDHLLPDEDRKKKATINREWKQDRRWPGGIVPYVFEPFFGEDAIKVVHAAMKKWMEDTCIQFVLRTNEVDYIVIVRKYGCWSYVGRKGGPQELSVGDKSSSNSYCITRGAVMHELGHAIGNWHEHSRPDRDKFVTIVWINIEEGKEKNFLKYTHEMVNSYGIEYDYDSIMHYNKRAFSKNRQSTIVPKENVKIGQRKYLSALDKKQASLLYKCSEKIHTLRPGLPTTPEPPILIQSGYNKLCIQAHLSTEGVHILLLSVCNQNSSSQQWKWNEENQLYNSVISKCISTGLENLLELRDCASGDSLQHWLCANHFIEQPSTGNCITTSEDSHQLIVEQCIIENNRQLWNKYTDNLQDEMERSLIRMLGDDSQSAEPTETICPIPGYHTVAECYDQKIHYGWSLCQQLGYFVTGLYHVGDLHLITDFRCCFTSHVFTGQPETSSSIELEICVNQTWWSSFNRKGWFMCSPGSYFKGYLKGEGEGWHAIQQVQCCRTEQAPSNFRQCYTQDANGAGGLHQCNRTAYHIAGVYKTDCSFVECVEKLYCCI